MDREECWFFAFLGFLGGFMLCFGIACYIGDRRRENWHTEAVESGHAEYVITDPATGETTFRWKEQPQ